MARIEILKNVVINTGKKLYREDTIQESTKVLYDFRSKWAGAGVSSNVAANKVIKNLALLDTATLTTKAATTVNDKGGVLFSKNTSLFTAAADNFPIWSDDNWVISLWCKVTELNTSTLFPVLHASSNSGWDFNLALASIIVVSDANGAFSHFYVGGMGVGLITNKATSDSALPSFDPKSPHLYTLKLTFDQSTNRVVLSFYVDGVLIKSGSVARPTSQALAYRFITSSNTNSSAAAGQLYRYRYDLIGNTGINADDLIKNEYEKCRTLYIN